MSVIKQIGIVLLISILAIKAMIAPVLLLDYEFRKEFIIKNYCVNKDRPELKCDGKCFLAKRLKAAQEKEENDAVVSFVKNMIECFCSSPALLLSDNEVVIKPLSCLNFSYTTTLLTSPTKDFFHPPRI
jgi:hypothetical protein